MISLKEYRCFWERVGALVGASHVCPITIDREMTKRIQSMGKGETVLFWLPPAAKSESSSSDNYRESNSCVVFVMRKYDPQREGSIEVLEDLQPVAESVKDQLLQAASSPCSPISPDVSTIDTMPETDFYGTLAGWSVGFRIKSSDV